VAGAGGGTTGSAGTSGAGGAGGAGAGGAGGVALTPADDAFLDNFCGLVEACCVVNASRPTPDVAGCKRQVAENGFSRDPSVQSACLSELQRLASAGIACFPNSADLTDPCMQLYYEPNGSNQPGQPCTVRADCAGAPGTITLCANGCLRLTPGQAGDGVCLGNVDYDGTINAEPAVVSGTTTQIISTGVVCERGAGLHCTFVNDLSMQTCKPLGAGGAPCSTDSLACMSETCDLTTSPDGGTSGTCRAVVAAGEACDTSAPCDDTTYCPSGSGSVPVCTPKVAAGGSCTSATVCAGGGNCTNGSCDQGLTVLGFCGRTYP
jgi:hypothetical protein